MRWSNVRVVPLRIFIHYGEIQLLFYQVNSLYQWANELLFSFPLENLSSLSLCVNNLWSEFSLFSWKKKTRVLNGICDRYWLLIRKRERKQRSRNHGIVCPSLECLWSFIVDHWPKMFLRYEMYLLVQIVGVFWSLSNKCMRAGIIQGRKHLCCKFTYRKHVLTRELLEVSEKNFRGEIICFCYTKSKQTKNK